MSFLTWNDVYHELWLQAAQSRGTVTSIGELPGTTRYSTLPEWPRTTGADAIAIASLVDPILSATPLRPGGYGITRLWQAAIIEIEAIAFPMPAAEYVHNRALWSTLLAVAAHLNTMGAPVPDEETWGAVLATLWAPAVAYRNATGPQSGPQTKTLTAPTFERMWDTLRAELATARGFDRRDDEIGGTIDVPRTTSADVRRLEAYWGRALVQLQLKVISGAVPSPEEFEDLQLEWQAVAGAVDEHAVHGNTHEVYPGNLEFWRATSALSTVLDVLEAGPAPYELVDAGKPAPVTPGRPPVSEAPPATPKATDLSSRLNEAADSAVTALAHLVNDASAGLVKTVGRPLLITGAAVAALILLLRGTADCNCAREPTADAEAR
jgi:hypothetical protein